MLLQGRGDGRLARGREAGEPDGKPALATELVALLASERRVPGDVACCGMLARFVVTKLRILGCWRGE
jgi:hypothetical protein